MRQVRFAAGIALMVLGLLAFAFDLARRIGRRNRHGGIIAAIWGPEQTPWLYFAALALLIAASVLLFGTASP